MAQQHINYSLPGDGLGDTLRTSQVKAESNFNELYANKVDKITGKGLSDTNFTQIEKDKLALIDPLDIGVQTDWDQGDNTQADYLKNKPTNVSDFFNDANFIPDVSLIGNFVRTAGAWVDLRTVNAIKIFDGIINVTAGFTTGQVAFTLPAGSICARVFVNGTLYYKTTPNNGSLVSRWSQTGDVVTITKTTVANNYIYIEYQ